MKKSYQKYYFIQGAFKEKQKRQLIYIIENETKYLRNINFIPILAFNFK